MLILRRFDQEEAGSSLLSLDASGQWVLPGHVAEALHTFEFEGDLAARWFPVGKAVPIVIDPRFSAGKPTIPSRRATIEAIYKGWKAGYNIQFIADDLRLKPAVTEEALRYAGQLAA